MSRRVVWGATGKELPRIMGITRRDFAALGGGITAGALLTPAPWKVLDDTAIWTQNWPWIPRPARGPVTTKVVACTLCAAGCGINARCLPGAVCGIAPVAGHPVSQGTLCPAVFGAHQLPYHARRLHHGLVHGRAVSAEVALKAAVEAIQKAAGPAVLLDERPGRAISEAYRKAMQGEGRSVVTCPQTEHATLDAAGRLTGLPPETLAYDFEHAGLILSFGAPLLDGWGTPGQLPRLWSRRGKDSGPIFVHAGARLSRSAVLSDHRFVLRPGSEGALAVGLAGALVRLGVAAQSSSRFAHEAAALPIGKVAELTGVPAPEIERLAKLLAETRPVIAIGGGEPESGGLGDAAEANIAALNALLGSLGTEGGILHKRHPSAGAAYPKTLALIPDQSLSILIHDASSPGVVVSEDLLRRKLAPQGILVRLTPFEPAGESTPEIVVPSTVFLEAADDSAGLRQATAATWSITPALLSPPEGAVPPERFAQALGEALGTHTSPVEDLMKRKCGAIYASRRGKLFQASDGSSTEVKSLAGAEALWKAMSEGGTWVDEPPGPAPFRAKLDDVAVQVPEVRERALTLMPVAWKARSACPLATKVEQEMRLRPVAGDARINPRTAREMGLAPGDAVMVGAADQDIRSRVVTEPLVAPGIVEMAPGGPQSGKILRMARNSVRIRKVTA